MNDFTLKTYKTLILELKSQGYAFKTFIQYINEKNQDQKSVILRHDVDKKPQNALKIAELEEWLGVRSSYYFRVQKGAFKKDIIHTIADLGHEIGYHYENLVQVSKKGKGERGKDLGFSRQKGESLSIQHSIFERAIEDFKKNLALLRKLYPVKTICMHGSPLSKFDSRDLWKKYDYRNFGITAEPYLDLNFNRILYLTDTGRRWNGEKVSVRDKVGKQELVDRSQEKERKDIEVVDLGNRGGVEEKKNLTNKQINKLAQSFHSTFDIIKALKAQNLPNQIMINAHPQRWTNKFIPWIHELVWQNFKNIIKRIFINSRR